MDFETCPLFHDIPWIKHGFFGADNPCALTSGLKGIHHFNDDFPQTVFLKQDHTDILVTDISKAADMIADASITNQNDIALAVKTADCCPVLLVCTHSKQIAAVHAGWRGALNRITAKTADMLVEKGAKPSHLIAAIGPSIHQETYPVQDDVRDQFISSDPSAEKHFIRFEDRWKVNVNGIVIDQLISKGVSTVWQSRINTFSNRDYASHRRGYDGGPNKRNVSIIMKTGDAA